MPITQTVYFDADVPVRGEDPIVFTTKANAAWVEMKNVINNELNPAFTQMNDLETNVNSKEASATASATSAATSATTATAKANICTAVVIPTTATYSYTQQDWRQSMMSKAEFNAVAAERRANRSGSGFDEFGKHNTAAQVINEGMFVYPTIANNIYLGNGTTSQGGISKTSYPMVNVNGYALIIKDLAFLSTSSSAQNLITLPPAPTVLPYDAVLTQQQIDSGVIKHADASNSGLIVNGKFDTDTSGWTTTDGAVLTVDAGRLKITNGTSSAGDGVQSFTTVIGKKYVVEATIENGTQNCRFFVESSLGTANLVSDTTGSVTAVRRSYEFTTTTTTTYIRSSPSGTSIGDSCYIDNIAVFPADAISRSDLVFLESWHEDISEKDFVYPLGNVQYLGTTGDGGTPVAGAFAGAETYSLFSDTWQADGALVGKGYVWSTLSDANKKAFVANPENNCYLDGDKVIQVRYRMRVVMGWGDSWTNVDTQAINYLANQTGVYVRPKGKLVVTTQADSGYGADTNGVFGNKNVSWTNLLSWNGDGHFAAADAYGDTNGFTAGSYNGQVFALPIALVHRRNQGMHHTTYNPNGTKLASDNKKWFETTVSFTSISDCFTESKLLSNSGSIASGVSGRPD